jgi:hypothetical protein
MIKIDDRVQIGVGIAKEAGRLNSCEDCSFVIVGGVT